MDPEALRELFSALRERSKGTPQPVELTNADLRGARLLRADLVEAELSGSQLDHSNLEGAQLGRARLIAAPLCGASLNGADLTEANLQTADLSEARLEGACLAGADLRGACLARIGGQPASLSGARIDLSMCERSRLSDAEVIQWWRIGATLVDLDLFSEAVRRACRVVDGADEQGPLERRRLIEEELTARRQRLRQAQSRPRPSQRLAAWTQLLQPPVLQSLAIQNLTREGESLVLHTPTGPASGSGGDDLPPPSLSRPVTPSYRAGDKLLGAYLLKQIGSGESGSVWKAELSDGQIVAVKYFDPSRATPGLGAPAFRRGVRALNRIMAAGSAVIVPKLYCVARNELSFVMEYCANGTVTGIPALGWGVARSLDFFKRLCRQVAALHELGMVHRCIKPNNVLIDPEFKPVLTDLNGVDLQQLALTRRGNYRLYAAPEELAGLGTESPTADIYSLGRVLHFLLLGADPSEPVHDVPSLDSLAAAPVWLVRIIRKATVCNAAMRYQRASELLLDLERHEQTDSVGLLLSSSVAADSSHVPSSLVPQALGLGRAPLRIKWPPQEAIVALPAKAEAPPVATKDPKFGDFTLSAALRRRLGLAGICGVAACVGFLLLVPAPDHQAASILGITLALSLALSTVLIQVRGPRSDLFNLALTSLVLTFSLQAEPDRIVLLRWKYTLNHGKPDERALVARSLARRAYRNFAGADLSATDLSGADLGRVSFRDANLRAANLTGAILQEADLQGADLTWANLTRADLFGSNVSGARGFPATICDRATILPSGWICNAGQPAPAEKTALR